VHPFLNLMPANINIVLSWCACAAQLGSP
jgi:hypothetical protein